MGHWIVLLVSGICCSLSLYLSLLAFRFGDNGAVLFAGFGLLSGAFFVSSTMRILAERCRAGKETSGRASVNSKPVAFVPHRFLMTTLIITAMAVIAAILIPVLFRGN